MNKIRTFMRFELVVLATLFLVAALPAAASAWQQNWKSCFKVAEGVDSGMGFSGPPVIDGQIVDDLGWTRAWRYVFHNGTPIHDVAVQVAKDTSYIYMSFEINNDSALNATDTIVVAFDTGSGVNSKKLLEIKPLINGSVRMGSDPDNPSGPSVETPQINYYTAVVLPFGGSTAPPVSTRARTTTSGSASNWSWRVEMKLSKTDFGIPSTGTFGLYLNTLVTQGTGIGPTGLTNEYAWPVPADSSEWLMGSPAEPPAVSKWGTATADDSVACNGVYIGTYYAHFGDIGTTNDPPTKVLLGQQNTIRANVYNSSIDANGNPKQAKQITTKFKYATFGISQLWNDIPADPGIMNPTAPKDIMAPTITNGIITPASDIFETKWTLPVNDPNFPVGGHTCILAELDTTATPTGTNDWTTVFVNKSKWNNFNYSLASRVDAAPVIDTRGWEKSPSRGKQQVELFAFSQINRIDPDIARLSIKGDFTINTKADNIKYSKALQARIVDPIMQLSRLEYFPVERNESFKEYVTKLQDKNVNVSQMVYSMHGCRRSGKFVRIDNVNLEICERVGSFGFGMRHAGLGTINWSAAKIQGAEYVGGNKNHLRMNLDEGERSTLKMRFNAVDNGEINNGCMNFFGGSSRR